MPLGKYLQENRQSQYESLMKFRETLPKMRQKFYIETLFSFPPHRCVDKKVRVFA